MYPWWIAQLICWFWTQFSDSRTWHYDTPSFRNAELTWTNLCSATMMNDTIAATPVRSPGGNWFWNLDAPAFIPSNFEGEGASLAMEAGRAQDDSIASSSTTWAKQHGRTPTRGDSPLAQRQVGKRSLARACRRAYVNGFAWYRGKRLTWMDFPADLRRIVESQPQQYTPSLRSPHQWNHRLRHRLVPLTFNCSGLTTQRYHDLLHWLSSLSIDFAVIAETHWKFTADWQTD